MFINIPNGNDMDLGNDIHFWIIYLINDQWKYNLDHIVNHYEYIGIDEF